jgi:hypothetical protein
MKAGQSATTAICNQARARLRQQFIKGHNWQQHQFNKDLRQTTAGLNIGHGQSLPAAAS